MKDVAFLFVECVWTFIAPAEYNVILEVDDVTVEERDCTEKLQNFNGNIFWGRLCKGDRKNDRIQLTTDEDDPIWDRIMTIKLFGPGSWFRGAKAVPVDISFKGMPLEMACPPQKIELAEGGETFLTSPEYPEMLAKSTHCAYVLEAPKGRLYF